MRTTSSRNSQWTLNPGSCYGSGLLKKSKYTNLRIQFSKKRNEQGGICCGARTKHKLTTTDLNANIDNSGSRKKY